MKVSIAELIDRLIILNLKLWHMEEGVRDSTKSDEEVGRITRVMTKINEQRSEIKAEIDDLLGGGATDLKIYTLTGLSRGDEIPKVSVYRRCPPSASVLQAHVDTGQPSGLAKAHR